jgi:hypothetical protein
MMNVANDGSRLELRTSLGILAKGFNYEIICGIICLSITTEIIWKQILEELSLCSFGLCQTRYPLEELFTGRKLYKNFALSWS